MGSVKPNGNLYHFDLNTKRTGLDLKGQLENKIAYKDEDLANYIFGKNFGVISDITVGPDGYLYIVSFTRGDVYRIDSDLTDTHAYVWVQAYPQDIISDNLNSNTQQALVHY